MKKVIPMALDTIFTLTLVADGAHSRAGTVDSFRPRHGLGKRQDGQHVSPVTTERGGAWLPPRQNTRRCAWTEEEQ